MNANLEPLRAAIAEAIHGMTVEDLSRHPEGKWCAAEILDHLNLTYIGTAKNLERCLRSGQTVASSDRSTKRWQRLVVTGLGIFPAGRKSPDRVLPRGAPPQQVTAEIVQNLARMEEMIRACEARLREGLAHTPIASVGPVVSDELKAHGLRADISPANDAYFMRPLITAMAEALANSPPRAAAR